MFNAFSRGSTLETAGNCYANGRSALLLPALSKSVSIIPIKKPSQKSLNTLSQDNKKMASVLFPDKQTFPETKISSLKKMNTPIMNTENNIVAMLRKLPDITFFLVPPKPVFKVPEAPKYHTKNTVPDYQSNVLYERTKDNVLCTNVADQFEKVKKINSNLKTNSNQIQKPKKKNNNIPMLPNNAGKRILKNPKTVSNINLLFDKKSARRTSSPKAKMSSFSQINLKNPETEKKVSSNPIMSHEVKNNTVNDLNISAPMNERAIKTVELNSDEYSFINTPTKELNEKKINSLSTTFSRDLNSTIPEYDGFLLGIGSTPEYITRTMQFNNSQSYVDKESLTGLDINTALNTNTNHNIHINSAPQSHCVDGNSYDYLPEVLHKGGSIDCINPNAEILPNNVSNFSHSNFDEYTDSIKRKQTQNELCKKQKTEDNQRLNN